MRKISIVIITLLLIIAYFFWRKENYKDEKPFEARVMAVNTKVDGTGYAIVLRSASDPNIWAAAVVTEIVKEGDMVIVDRANDKIIYNDNKEGRIIKKK